MLRLSFAIGMLLYGATLFGQSPHGKDFVANCSDCHTTEGWKITKGQLTFNHDTTRFKLIGQHQAVDCKSCHKSLDFSTASSECSDCHQDLHENTVGTDCARCHSPKSWIVQNISEIHQQTRFPLSGAHQISDCAACHKSVSKLRFDPQGIACVDCHRATYLATTKPNHEEAGYSTNCIECHTATAGGWGGADFEHSFFPLSGGHAVDCKQCHLNEVYTKVPKDCISCHEKDYQNSTRIKHQELGFSTNCTECHSTSPGWTPASFTLHDSRFFPVYSGKHKGTWSSCTECHTKGSDFSTFSCTDCHEHNKISMDNNHREEKDYAFSSPACFVCHPTGNTDGQFKHDQTNFPLTGKHQGADCLGCHTKGFAGTSMVCNSCHEKEYIDSKTPGHSAAGIPTGCETCHGTSGWKPSTFNHLTTGYELTGGHTRVVQCSDCHAGSVITAKQDCISCHQVQYDNAKEHKLHSYPLECRECHSTENWKLITFDHALTKFPLTGVHVTTECVKCHGTGYAGTPLECNACHKTNYAGAQLPNHTGAGISVLCETCHTSSAWKPSTFTHTTTGFELAGGHSKIVQCTDCHKGTTLNTPTQCITCHQVQYDNAKDHKAQSFPADCKMCHNINNWQGAKFDHSLTRFPLLGAHSTTDCIKCHPNGFFAVSTECNSCHAINYSAAKNPSHTAAGIPVQCGTCHSSSAWKPSSFNHTTTGFELTGDHRRIAQCSDCHKGTTSNTPNQCISCHKVQYDNAKDHKALSFPVECNLCHTTNNWLGATFDHSKTKFPLTGAHTTALCTRCHANGYSGTSTECNACHTANYGSAEAPRHSAAGIPVQCESCHNTTAWKPSSFNHQTTGYVLAGRHALIVQCSDCHKGSTQNTPTECNSCHHDNYTGAKNPNHAAAGLAVDCGSCHSQNKWKPATFNHVTTGYALTGGHSRVVQCSDCHKGSTLNTPTDCISCHKVQYDNAKDHKTQSYPVDCKMCHNIDSWQNALFSHSQTRFPLTGAHLTTTCASCHKNGFTGTSTECNSCHASKYAGAQTPGHSAAGISVLCESCHTTSSWKPSSFNHATTGFALAGGHSRIVQCSDCHKGTTQNTPNQCITCHQIQYNNAKDHKTQSYPVDCNLCHNANNWQGATFNHSATRFPLTGSHTTATCASCHKNGFTGTPTDCNSCHASNYTGSQTPGHVAAGISKLCETCHSTIAWKPSTFNHTTTGFALTGGHLRIVQCSDCHKGTTQNTPIQCVSCHQTQYDSAKDHKAQSYPVDCSMCHNINNWQGAVFNHSVTRFPLTGAHTTATCGSCHKNGFTGTPTDCNSCHASNYAGSQTPGHTAAGISVACETCHSTTSWKPSSFQHATTGYTLTGGHARVIQCSACHHGTTQNAPTDCYSCHTQNYNQTTNPAHLTAQFPKDCTPCHSTNAWKPSTFNHDAQYFPIYSGHHKGKWALCSECHNVPTNYSVFACINCHEHSKASTDNDHRGVRNYSYNSVACFTCHPRG